MKKVVSLRPRNGAVVELLEEALEQARRGEITGVALAGIGPGKKYTHALSRAAKQDPARTLWALERLVRDLHKQADELEMEA